MGLKRELGQESRLTNGHAGGQPIPSTQNGDTTENGSIDEPLDMLVVGAGFAGVWLIHKLRHRGFKVKIVDVSVCTMNALPRFAHSDSC